MIWDQASQREQKYLCVEKLSNKKGFLINKVFLFWKGQEIPLNHIIMLTL